MDPIEQFKANQKVVWSGFAPIENFTALGAPRLVRFAGIRPGSKVLDVGCGTGVVAITAARGGAKVTGLDLTPELVARAKENIALAMVEIDLHEGDAEALPFADGIFDVVVSTYGCMFTPDHSRTASEMLRVTRPGGRIGMANWTPQGFIGRLFKVIGAHVPPPAGLKSPALWGTEAHVAALFGGAAADVRCERKHFNFRYRSAAHWLQVFRDFYGPTHKAFAALDVAGQAALERDITALLLELNVAGEASLVVPGEYLEVVIAKR